MRKLKIDLSDLEAAFTASRSCADYGIMSARTAYAYIASLRRHLRVWRSIRQIISGYHPAVL